MPAAGRTSPLYAEVLARVEADAEASASPPRRAGLAPAAPIRDLAPPAMPGGCSMMFGGGGAGPMGRPGAAPGLPFGGIPSELQAASTAPGRETTPPPSTLAFCQLPYRR